MFETTFEIIFFDKNIHLYVFIHPYRVFVEQILFQQKLLCSVAHNKRLTQINRLFVFNSQFLVDCMQLKKPSHKWRLHIFI